MNAVNLINISKEYSKTGIKCVAVNNVNLTIEPGEFVSIVGPSGSGKSTLLYIIGLLTNPTSGEYYLLDRNVSDLNDGKLSSLRNWHIGIIFQTFNLLSRYTVAKNVRVPLFYGNKNDTGLVDKILGEVGLQNKKNNLPSQLSGGEMQRVAIARALINNPEIILADEPTGNLDSHNEANIMEILVSLNKTGKTVVLVTHNENLTRHSSKIFRMKDGALYV